MWGLLLGALALDAYNENRADNKRKRTLATYERKNTENTKNLAESTTDTAVKTFGTDRQQRDRENQQQLEGDINALIDAQPDTLDTTSTSDPGGTEQAKRVAERKQRQVEMAKLLSRFGAHSGNALDNSLMLAEGANQAQGVGRDMRYDYDQFVKQYNSIKPNSGLSAVSAIMRGAALGQMMGAGGATVGTPQTTTQILDSASHTLQNPFQGAKLFN